MAARHLCNRVGESTCAKAMAIWPCGMHSCSAPVFSSSHAMLSWLFIVPGSCSTTIITDTTEQAKEVAFHSSQRQKVVSLDGTLINKAGIITGGCGWGSAPVVWLLAWVGQRTCCAVACVGGAAHLLCGCLRGWGSAPVLLLPAGMHAWQLGGTGNCTARRLPASALRLPLLYRRHAQRAGGAGGAVGCRRTGGAEAGKQRGEWS